MMFEHRSQHLLPRHQWHWRIARSVQLAMAIVVATLSIGIVGYHIFGALPWIDAFLEAAMILGGMGAIAPMHSVAHKIFSGCYALLSGFVVLSASGVILAPWIHRMLHYFHADTDRK